jgi:hypothetical protein
MTTPSHVPHTYNICKVPQSRIEFQVQIQVQRPGSFSKASQRQAVIGGWVTITNQTLNISLIMVKLKHVTVDDVINHPDT